MRPVNGYVAFLDVLGFSDLIARDDRLAAVDQYTGAVKHAVESAAGSADLRFVLFSDSIIVSTQDEGPEALGNLLEACSRVFGALLSLEVPVRGAVAYGSFIRSETNEGGAIVAGRPITEAYRWEKQQDWAGISLAPSVLRHVQDLEKRCAPKTITSDADLQDLQERLQWVAHLLSYDYIPFHIESPGEPETVAGFAVVPLDDEVQTVEDIARGARRLWDRAGRMRVVAPDPKSQRKCLKLRRFLKHVDTTWSERILKGKFLEQNPDRVSRLCLTSAARGGQEQVAPERPSR